MEDSKNKTGPHKIYGDVVKADTEPQNICEKCGKTFDVSVGHTCEEETDGDSVQ